MDPGSTSAILSCHGIDLHRSPPVCGIGTILNAARYSVTYRLCRWSHLKIDRHALCRIELWSHLGGWQVPKRVFRNRVVSGYIDGEPAGDRKRILDRG
ncbi:hypothetical protein Jann_2061 [Jannaschia sp. CCS1]|nr:hypothetical protein Jann_2061 [Jannaschia sp. CCS1]